MVTVGIRIPMKVMGNYIQFLDLVFAMQGKSRRLLSRWLATSNNNEFSALRNHRTDECLHWNVLVRGVELPLETLEEISNAETSVALYYDFNSYSTDYVNVVHCYVESSPEDGRG
ncbi:hypothetical protein ACOME3_009325 [Neoechinorhynchus agilis]